ncbi:secreted RxLR effector protein 161-like [Nicotiana tabacum]|uniref:Secreted RxLR effector protein 161-like n=1 Tax=Nicotiana tabacum TaxID=4097 RepID=A0AC58STQ0_TOBAC
MEHFFDKVIKTFGFDKYLNESCVYKKCDRDKVAFLILYVDDILLIGDNVGMLGSVKQWHGISLSNDQSPKTDKDIEKMNAVPYASAVGSLIFQSNLGREQWTAVKHIINYLKRTRNYMLVYHSDDLVPIGYTNSDFQSDRDSRKSTSGNVFTLGGGAISWKSIKKTFVVDSTMVAECVVASEAAKEVVWLGNFLRKLGVVPSIQAPIALYCDNSGALTNLKDP